MKRVILSLFITVLCTTVYCDIAPSRISARGIGARYNTEVRMVSEQVLVTLTLDSSFVHCYFRLHNEGKAESMEIGFPYMDTRPYSPEIYAPISIYQNGKEISEVNLASSNNDAEDLTPKTWYWWKTKFDGNEYMDIEVVYSLPYCQEKNGLYSSFEYLLSTGAGWKDRIDDAEVIVTFKNFDKNLILRSYPSNAILSDDKMVWKFRNIEPDETNDISINYEPVLGSYNESLKNMRNPASILNESTVLSWDIRDKNYVGNVIQIKKLTAINLLRKEDVTLTDFPDIDCKYGLLLYYNEDFIPNRFIRALNSFISGNDSLKAMNLKKLQKNYSLYINGDKIKSKNIPDRIIIIKPSDIIQAKLKKRFAGKPSIYLTINVPRQKK
jgi:hypothetical protein